MVLPERGERLPCIACALNPATFRSGEENESTQREEREERVGGEEVPEQPAEVLRGASTESAYGAPRTKRFRPPSLVLVSIGPMSGEHRSTRRPLTPQTTASSTSGALAHFLSHFLSLFLFLFLSSPASSHPLAVVSSLPPSLQAVTKQYWRGQREEGRHAETGGVVERGEEGARQHQVNLTGHNPG
eukprot:976421-Rhodomonas_salina.1